MALSLAQKIQAGIIAMVNPKFQNFNRPFFLSIIVIVPVAIFCGVFLWYDMTTETCFTAQYSNIANSHWDFIEAQRTAGYTVCVQRLQNYVHLATRQEKGKEINHASLGNFAVIGIKDCGIHEAWASGKMATYDTSNKEKPSWNNTKLHVWVDWERVGGNLTACDGVELSHTPESTRRVTENHKSDKELNMKTDASGNIVEARGGTEPCVTGTFGVEPLNNLSPIRTILVPCFLVVSVCCFLCML